MAQATNYLEDGLLNHYFGGTPFTKPAGLEISFHDQSPGETGSELNEVFPLLASARFPIVFGSNATGREIANTSNPQNNAVGSGTATYWAVHRTDGAGEMLLYQELQESTSDPTPKPMSWVAGQLIQINAGDMVWDYPQETSGVFSDFLVNDWLSFVLGPQATSGPWSNWLSLHSSDPGETGVGEFSVADYARQSIAWDPPDDGANNRRRTRNTAQVDFTNLNASDTPIDWWGVWSAVSAGSFLARSDQTDQIITTGDNASAAANALSLLAG